MLVTEKKTNVETLIHSLITSKINFALYRLPQTENVKLIVGEEEIIELDQVNFEELTPGFVFAPYRNSSGKPLYIKANQIKDLKISEENTSFDLYLEEKTGFDLGFSLESNKESDNKEVYLSEAHQVIEHIKAEEARKVVLSRKKNLGKIKESNYWVAFKRLCKNYPDAMISLVSIPKINQIWMCASPEILVSQDKNGIFKTMSLAGTQSAKDSNGKDIEPIDALWSHKEIEEQALVGRYIINCLKKIRVREFEEEGPKTVKAGNLLHLRTVYSIDTKTIEFDNFSSIMLELLHPTPAVCGMPKEKAEEVIANVEKHDREFYSGYLGPIDIDLETHLYVNLRSIKVQDNQVYAYAGGGLLADSNPEKEWTETEIKMQTIQKAFDTLY